MRGVLRAARRRLFRALTRRRFVRSFRSDDHFVCTYPKSGTNWLGFFLACALTRNEPDEIRDAIDLVSYRRWVPDINRHYVRREPLDEHEDFGSPRFLTLHAAYDPLLARVVNVVRDPRDVMVSYYYHCLRSRKDFDQPIHDFVEANQLPPCDWGEHVAGWLQASKRGGVHVVRYEDLKADPIAGFRGVADFCRLGLSEDGLADCVRRSSFESMRKKERLDEGTKQQRPSRFIRRGKVDGWRDDLEDRTVALIENRYRDLMLELGYVLTL